MILRKRFSSVLREQIVSAVLDCGLRVYAIPKKGYAKKVGIFAVRYGSVDMTFTPAGREKLDTPPGIAHFLEHQLFKKAGGEDVLMEFGKYGASSNAYTTYAATAYYFTASGEFEKNLELLVGFVSAPYFDAGNVAKEKLIIEQELRMYEDSPDYTIYKNLMSALYTVHPVRLDVGGSVESIQKIDRDLLESCYRMFYNPANMVLLVGGDIDPAAAFRRVEAALPKGFRPQGTIARHLPSEPAGVKDRVVRFEKEISRPRVLLGFKDLTAGGGKALDREIQTSVVLDLIFGRSGSFYTRAYEEGLIDDSFSCSFECDDAYGYSLIGGETDEPEKLAEAVLLELHKARKGRFKKRDVERSKRKRLGRFLRSFDSPDGAAFLLMDCAQREIDLFSVPRVISRLAPKALEKRLAEHFDERNYAVSILMPRLQGSAKTEET